MRHWSFAAIILLVLCALSASSQPRVSAQDAEQAAPLSAHEYADRARRLREFGYPELAEEQLAIAARSYPTDRMVVLEHLRLLTRTRADIRQIGPWIALAHKLYAEDFDCCFALAHYLYLNEQDPAPPQPENLEPALERLGAEMRVFRALADYILKPQGELPSSASPELRTNLPLAYLARCASVKPGDINVLEFAARYVDMLGCRFQDWSTTHPDLELFEHAAFELFARALQLWERAEPDERFTGYARMRKCEILFRMGRLEDARVQAAAADLVAPGSRRIAEILQAIAQQTDDFDLLVEALERARDAWPNETTRLDVLAARRVRDNKWSMDIWMSWLDLRSLEGPARITAAQALARELPEFLELYVMDAALRVEYALGEAPAGERAKTLEAALKVLERCKALADQLADWHGMRATIFWTLGRYEEASEAFRQVAELDRSDARALDFSRAAADIAAGKYNAQDWHAFREQADSYSDFRVKIAVLKDITERSPAFFRAQAALSKLALMTQDYETARKAALAALKQVPENLEAIDNAAHASMWLGDFVAAAGWFEKLHDLSPGYQDADRWHSLCTWAAAAAKEAQEGVTLWLRSTSASISTTEKRRLVESAVRAAPAFPEARVDLAELMHNRGEDLDAMEMLDHAQRNVRDHWVRAAIHRTRGRVYAKQNRVDRAISEFEAAYSALPGDGGDLLLAALSLHSNGNHAGASAAMRKLFSDIPDTVLLRPTPSEAHLLDLVAVEPAGARNVSAGYSVGDKLRFRVSILVSGEGGGQFSNEVSTEFDMLAEVTATPANGGVWKLAIEFANPPSPEWNALAEVKTLAIISPWFGLCEEPVVGMFEEVVHPAIQALAEGLTAGMGDSPLVPPYVWKNSLTKGPPHFGRDDPEGSFLAAVTGDSFTIRRRSLAGRKVGSENARDSTFSRVLEAVVEAGGPRNALRKVSFDIGKEELSPKRDDVVRSRLHVTITAR